jgi:hypothetical protein
MENAHSFIHSLIFCKRKTDFLPLPFAYQNDDEELNPILSRLEVVAIPIVYVFHLTLIYDKRLLMY